MRPVILFVLAMHGVSALSAQQVKHIILVSIDGFRPDFYLDEKWPAPNLQYLAKHGAGSEGVNGVFPSVTYPSHTTIISGVPPATHGVFYNTPVEPLGATGLWNSEYKVITSETIWDAAKRAGMTTASVSWPVSIGAPVDYNIPEAFILENPLDRRIPTSKFSTPAGLFEEVQQKATGEMQAIDLNINHSKIDENLGRIAAYLFKTYRPALTTLHLPGVDHAQHSEGREGDHVKFAIANADRVIGSLLETINLSDMKDSTAIIITGDHGFVTVKKRFSPNILLANAGLLDEKPGPGRKWKAMFQATGGSAFLRLKDSTDKQTLTKVRALLNNLPDSIRSMYRVVEKAELKKIGADPYAEFALAAKNNISMNAATTGDLVANAKGGTHGYFPDFQEIRTGFVGYGAGFSNGANPAPKNLTDIAPLVAKLLNLNFSAGKLRK